MKTLEYWSVFVQYFPEKRLYAFYDLGLANLALEWSVSNYIDELKQNEKVEQESIKIYIYETEGYLRKSVCYQPCLKWSYSEVSTIFVLQKISLPLIDFPEDDPVKRAKAFAKAMRESTDPVHEAEIDRMLARQEKVSSRKLVGKKKN